MVKQELRGFQSSKRTLFYVNLIDNPAYLSVHLMTEVLQKQGRVTRC